MAKTTQRHVTFKGNPLTLEGKALKVGQTAPDCALVTNDLAVAKISQLRGKKIMISVVPSLDTPVCDIQTKKFNQETLKLSGDTAIITVSMDLPFAQKRWCLTTESKSITTLSDYQGAKFGKAYGVLIKELYLLARSIFVLDEKGKIRYIQIVNEVTQEPDYNAALNALKKL